MADRTQCRFLLPEMEPQKWFSHLVGWATSPFLIYMHPSYTASNFINNSSTLASDPRRRWNHSVWCINSSHIVFHRRKLQQPYHRLSQPHAEATPEPGLLQEGARQGVEPPFLRHQYKAATTTLDFWITVLIGPHAELHKANKHRTSAPPCDPSLLTEFRKDKPAVTTALVSSLNN